MHTKNGKHLFENLHMAVAESNPCDYCRIHYVLLLERVA